MTPEQADAMWQECRPGLAIGLREHVSRLHDGLFRLTAIEMAALEKAIGDVFDEPEASDLIVGLKSLPLHPEGKN